MLVGVPRSHTDLIVSRSHILYSSPEDGDKHLARRQIEALYTWPVASTFMTSRCVVRKPCPIRGGVTDKEREFGP